MKAITLWQPWASLVADKVKRFETRSFQIKHRGLLAIHAAKTIKGMERFKYNSMYNVDNLPFGKIICIVELTAIHKTNYLRQYMSQAEIAVGNWSDGRYAWTLKLIKKFKEPIPAIGRQGLWNIDTKLLVKEFKP